MSQPVTVSIPHRLGKAEATRRLRSGIGNARDQFGSLLRIEDDVWTGDTCAFRVTAMGQTASGTIEVAEEHVTLSVLLPGLLGKFADLVRGKLKKQATLMLDKK